MNEINNPNLFDFHCYHYANKGATSWFNFAKKIMDFSKRNCKITPCLNSEFPTPAIRPIYSILDTSRVEKTLSLSIRNWETALGDCIKKIQYNEVI
jgi:dTDP-4-dehydrorhamnose reductase